MLARLVGGAEPWSLLPLRIVVGVVFLVHGSQKLLVFGLAGFAGYLGKLGIEPALFWSVVVTAVEFLGGIAVLVGLLTRWAALFLAVDLLVAIVTVHLPKGFFMDKGGYEFPLTLLGACLTILLAGAKTPSVDRRLPREI
jgi:putative oxidoreductase